MNFIIIIAFITILLPLNASVASEASAQLHHYELISLKDIDRRIHKRSIDHQQQSIPATTKEFRQIEFHAFNRKFRLMLNEKKEILGDHFKAYTVDEHGKKEEITNFEPDEFYEGNLIGKQRSGVTAHIERQTGLITGSIYDDDENEAYFIEPASNLFNKSAGHDDRMVIYRQKDIKDQRLNDELQKQLNQQLANATRGFCGYIKINETVNEANITNVRPKRQADDDLNSIWAESKLENTKCSLRLVADYTFVDQMGNNDATKTINFLVNLISEVDTIFRRTNWTYTDSDPEPMFGYGFLVTELLIHEKPFNEASEYTTSDHYNTQKQKWKVRDLLEAFSRAGTHKSFCLSHLFTHRTFENGILGLAYVSSPRQYSYGGICSQPYYKDGGFLYLNTGLTTTKNSFGNRVLTRQAVLITAHELGHNFGSEHDPNLPECSPKTKQGGAYIMNTFSVSSYDANNQFFSICSKRSIKSVLKVKAKDCFSKPKSTFCGNGIVERGEECDPGLTSPSGDDCCTKNCRLKAGAMCNDRNSPCCTQCRYSTNYRVCLDANELDCKRESYCNGQSAECPKPSALPDETICAEDGHCSNGECIPFCEKHGLLSCMCDQVADACRKCCKQSLNSTCSPYKFADGDHFHRDGTICLRGFCAKGKCVNVSQDYVERFWSIIDDIEYNNWTMFLKDNLVCCVIVVSLIVFIPCWYLIEQYDRKMKAKVQRKEKERSYSQRKHLNSLADYANQSRNQRRIPRNRQQFSTSVQGKFRKVLDDSNYQPQSSSILSSNNQQHPSRARNGVNTSHYAPPSNKQNPPPQNSTPL